jgi:hypothetical protein
MTRIAPMTASIHYLNGREAALVKLGFMGLNPEQWQHAGLRAAGGGAAGAGIGALAADDNDGLQGAMLGGLAGAVGAGGASALGKGLELRPGLQSWDSLLGGQRPGMPKIREADAARIAEGLTGAGAGGTMAGGAAMGALPAIMAGRSTRNE